MNFETFVILVALLFGFVFGFMILGEIYKIIDLWFGRNQAIVVKVLVLLAIGSIIGAAAWLQSS